MIAKDDLRAELASIAASLRAYLEVQADTGATGIPRGARPERPAPDAPLRPATTEPVEERSRAEASTTAREVTAPPPVPTLDRAPSLSTRSLEQLAADVAACTRCALHATRKQTVFSRGNPKASLCFVGEAPGADEDDQGLPFVGRAGQLLDRMIAAMGLLPETDVYVCNIIKCRPPGNRRPEPAETAACLPYLHEQLAIMKPKVIVAMGNTAVSTLLGTTIGISKIRGQWKLYRGTTLVMPTYHPSYLLRPSPQQMEAKRQAWEDLQAVMRELRLPIPTKGPKAES
jgi:uracil-DNA glycosylase